MEVKASQKGPISPSISSGKVPQLEDLHGTVQVLLCGQAETAASRPGIDDLYVYEETVHIDHPGLCFTQRIGKKAFQRHSPNLFHPAGRTEAATRYIDEIRPHGQEAPDGLMIRVDAAARKEHAVSDLLFKVHRLNSPLLFVPYPSL